MHALHREAEERYQKIRREALAAAGRQLPTGSEYNNISLRLISREALAASVKWDDSPKRRVAWDWEVYYPDYRFRYPKRFELAVWDGARLAALSLGRPTYEGTAVRLDVIEGSPSNAPEFKVVLINLRAMAIYADLVGAQQLRIMKPINEEVRQYYEGYGLTYVAKGDYLFLNL